MSDSPGIDKSVSVQKIYEDMIESYSQDEIEGFEGGLTDEEKGLLKDMLDKISKEDDAVSYTDYQDAFRREYDNNVGKSFHVREQCSDQYSFRRTVGIQIDWGNPRYEKSYQLWSHSEQFISYFLEIPESNRNFVRVICESSKPEEVVEQERKERTKKLVKSSLSQFEQMASRELNAYIKELDKYYTQLEAGDASNLSSIEETVESYITTINSMTEDADWLVDENEQALKDLLMRHPELKDRLENLPD